MAPAQQDGYSHGEVTLFFGLQVNLKVACKEHLVVVPLTGKCPHIVQIYVWPSSVTAATNCLQGVISHVSINAFNTHFQISHGKWKQQQKNNKNWRVCFYTWGGFCLCQKTVNAQNGRWRWLFRINCDVANVYLLVLLLKRSRPSRRS